MRTGIVQQALTPEAASALKHSLNLAKRRGHAQVTPLHVATTLLSSTSTSTSSKETTNLLRRACLHSHPLHCRALELCFNVALNRLPSIPPPSSNSLLPINEPSLSNSLIAALKRAQAHQRRNSIELQQQQQQHQQQQQQLQEQPLLAIKVELEQLIISILDDPSVSRVMREAGFSSTSVKANVEEFCSASVYGELYSYSQFLRNHFSRPPFESQEEDLNVVMEVMSRKQSRRRNIVLVGDSVLKTEWLVAELMERVRRAQVPDELKSSQFIKLQISHSHLRNMSINEVEMTVFDLRRKMASLLIDGNVIIYVGDLMWVVGEEVSEGGPNRYNALDHLVQEVGRLLSEMRSCNKVWLMAVASYQTYMRCQKRQPSLETQWGLHAVVVPSGGLGLSLEAPSGKDSVFTVLNGSHYQMDGLKIFNVDEHDRLICCSGRDSNYEKEASIFRFSNLGEKMNIGSGSTSMPYSSHTHGPDNYDKGALLGMKRKWSELGQAHHHAQYDHTYHPSMFSQNLAEKRYAYASRHPWWSSTFPYNQDNVILEAQSITFPKSMKELISVASPSQNASSECKERNELKPRLSESNNARNTKVRTTLALASPLFSDSATSESQRVELLADPQKLCRHLQGNIPWQSDIIPSIVESLLDSISIEKKWTCLLIRGADQIGKRRLAKAISEIVYESTESLVHINMKKTQNVALPSAKTIFETLKKGQKRVILIEYVDQADTDFLESLAKNLKQQSFEGPTIFILTTASSSITTRMEEEEAVNANLIKVLQMRMQLEEQGEEVGNKSKKLRQEKTDLDLNISAEEDDSGLTQEIEDRGVVLPADFLELISLNFTFNARTDWSQRVMESFSMKLHRAFEDAGSDRKERGWWFSVDQMVLEGLVEASDMVLEIMFEEWLTEVFQKSLLLFKKGGKVRLSMEGTVGNVPEDGFEGSLLPNRIHVDLDE